MATRRNPEMYKNKVESIWIDIVMILFVILCWGAAIYFNSDTYKKNYRSDDAMGSSSGILLSEENSNLLLYENVPIYGSYGGKLEKGRWYYYDHLEPMDQFVYELIEELVNHRSESGYVERLYVKEVDDSVLDHFWQIYQLFLFDHPECFYLEMRDMIISGSQYEDHIEVSFTLGPTMYDEDELISIFQDTTEQFMAEIDLNNPAEIIELQVHDKLVSMLTYNHRIEKDNVLDDLGRTAYGAFVEDSAGEEHCVVCSGYAYAFEYCMQVAGIYSAVIFGTGVTYDKGIASRGGHAWNMVFLEDDREYGKGEWYCVDCCWDDAIHEGELTMEDIFGCDKESYARITHQYYNRTTEEFEQGVCEFFEFDGYIPFTVGNGMLHMDEEEIPHALWSKLMPEARGKKCAFSAEHYLSLEIPGKIVD